MGEFFLKRMEFIHRNRAHIQIVSPLTYRLFFAHSFKPVDEPCDRLLSFINESTLRHLLGATHLRDNRIRQSLPGDNVSLLSSVYTLRV